ncbi:hypothetical protein CUMW_251260 [Citrus unshiu]|uniref:Uncharacterized protein n=1 Tax=Citrus unshiu TaxID=55188 RepID=A0A2H5QQ88_CITUN|nr:hypothetical protein CUMW_251260 [Citrus unshiu]
MLEIIVTLVLELVKCLAPPTERQLVYLRKRNYNANLENLKAEMEKLKLERTSIQRRVSEAKEKGEEIEGKVEKWLVSANGIIDRAAKFVEDEESTNKRCLKGLCPNLKTRYQLSKKAETDVKALVELGEEVKKLDIVSHRTTPEEIWLKSNKGYEAFESRVSTLKSIQNALTDVNVSIIGVYGMGGIGKTTLVKEFARQAREKKLFDRVVFSEVSQTPDIKKIQGEIAEKLGLELSNEAEYRRASRLYERLKNENKILVILDNIWKHVDLETIMIGDDVDNCKFKSTAINVAQACGGLPIALTTVSRAPRNKSLHEWKNALRELQTPSVVNFEGVPAETYSSIELSFKYLKGEQLKQIFLLCSLIGNSFGLMDLLRYSMGLGIFHGVNKMEDARNKLYALVHELRDCCLLLEGDRNETFYMHDVVCDVAVSIACRGQHVFLVRNDAVWEWPDGDALKKCYAISLLNSSIHEVSLEFECPQLEFLHIDITFAGLNIPDNFFKEMKKLRVVDLTRVRLFSLPSSIDGFFTKKLERFDISIGDGSFDSTKALELNAINVDEIWHYNQLPAMVPCLRSLTRLIVWGCDKLKYIFSASTIQSLEQLQHLEIRLCKSLQEIISENRTDQVTAYFVFPRVTTLKLEGLPELRCLYPGIHTSEWPALKNLAACNCDKITLSQNDENDQFGVPAQQPLFSFKKILPTWRDCALSGKDITMILQDDFHNTSLAVFNDYGFGDDDLPCFPLAFTWRSFTIWNFSSCRIVRTKWHGFSF